MPTNRAGVGLCSFNDEFIFAFGGKNSETSNLNVIESYKISSNSWRQIDISSNSQWSGAYLSMGT